MMTNTMYGKMNTNMTAGCNGGTFCCTRTSSVFNTVVLFVLGAVILASIIICAQVLIPAANTPLVRTTAQLF